MVKLYKSEPKFYQYLQLTKHFDVYSMNLTLFLKNGIETIDHMYFLMNENKVDGELVSCFIFKPKDLVYSTLFTFDSNVRLSSNGMVTLKQKMTINIGKILTILPWQNSMVFMLDHYGELYLFNINTMELTNL